MRQLLGALGCLSLAATCCGRPPAAPFNPVTTSVADTVALVIEMPVAEKVRPFCSGVWIASDWILTAKHCTMTTNVETDEEDEDTDEAFTTQQDYGVFKATVAYRDTEHDLALLHTNFAPTHTWANVANRSPAQGDSVHVVGHPVGFWWTYLTGIVAGYREHSSRFEGTGVSKGPYIQLQVPIFQGSSGGGAFDAQGRLVGICSFITSLPGEGFFVPVESIKPFLTKSHVP